MNDLVFIKRHQAVCDSLQVAEKFQKRHDNVMRAVGNLLKNEVVSNALKNEVVNNGLKNEPVKLFQLSKYKDAKGEYRKKYLMNRDGFTLLAMGFTGQEALIWKLRYIQAFNLMEQSLLQQQSPVWKDTRAYQKAIRRQETDTIKLFVEYAQSQGSAHSDQYYTQFSLLANKAVGITDRELATVQQLNILAMVENMIARRIEELITGNMPYKAIYQDCKDYIAGFQKYIGVDTGMTFSCQSME